MCCHGRKAKDHGVDRTPYQGDRKISYVSYHTRAISMGITKAESRTLIDVGRRAPRKGPPLPHARRRPSRARAYISERRPRFERQRRGLVDHWAAKARGIGRDSAPGTEGGGGRTFTTLVYSK
jgi:hypothetical protein